MASSVRVSFLADTKDAIKSVTKFRETVDEDTKRVVTSIGDPKLTGSWGKWQEGFDVLDTRAMGFRDTITGAQDTVSAFNAIMGKGEDASKSWDDKLLLLGYGIGDTASGLVNFAIPLVAAASSLNGLSLATVRATIASGAHKVATVAGTAATGAMTAAQWLLNSAFLANPIGAVIVVIIALVAAFVIAYKKSATFRNIVNGAFKAVGTGASRLLGWIKKIPKRVGELPGKIKGAFSGAKNWLSTAGKNVVDGFLSGLKGAWDSVTGWLSDATESIPLHKGPPSRDRILLRESGRLIMGGLIDGMDSQRAPLESSLRATTSQIAGSVSPVTGSAGSSRSSAVTVRAGDKVTAALLDELRAEIRRRGGDVQFVLGS